jgi:hypothetical protein
MKRNIQQTSIESYHNIKHLGDKQSDVLITIAAYPNLTDSEIAVRLGKKDPNVVRPRRYELVHDYGLVVSSGKRVCTVTGKTALTWRIK